MNPILQQAQLVWSQAVEIWFAGGWAMIVIAAVALVMFALAVQVLLKLRGKRFRSVREKTWRRWIDHPQERRGRIGELIDMVAAGRSIQQTTAIFNELRKAEVTPLERDLRVIRICVSAAPLVGLLGTVTGMLTTFSALSSGSGGDQTMEMVAGGISEALITTETGLVIALPGLFFQHYIARTLQRYKVFLAHLETVCTQSLYRRIKAQHQNIRRAA